MRYRLFGRTGLYVSEICFGTMTFGGKGFWKAVGRTAEADRLVGAALDAGVNFFDTADVYSEGESERLLGNALGAAPRTDSSSRPRCAGGSGPGRTRSASRAATSTRSIDASLKRLGTDYIDLYQIHGFDPVTPLDETLRALDDLVRAARSATSAAPTSPPGRS